MSQGADIAALRARFPSAFGPAPHVRTMRWIVVAVIALYVVSLFVRLDVTPARLLPGLSKLGLLIAQMFPPSPGDYLWEILHALGETIAMAFLGTMFASLLALPLGFLGAKTVVSNSALHFALRRVFDFFRGVPALIWALIFVRAVGLGPMAGVLAIAASDTAALSKLTAEAIENADRKASDAVKAAGAGNIVALRYGLLPQVLPVYLSQALYFFESNVRSSAILGIVGAGGIGFELAERIRGYLWPDVAFIIIVFLITVAIIDQISRALRKQLIEAGLDKATRLNLQQA